VSNRWTSGSVSTNTDALDFDLQLRVPVTPYNRIRVLSGQWAHIQVRLTFSKTATPGPWTIMTAPAINPDWFRGANIDTPFVNYVDSVNRGAFPVYTIKLV
jgi:hypothetical protein